jgi:hypothetical protein
VLRHRQLTARDRTDNQKRFFPRRNCLGQRSVGRFVGEIFLASKKAQKRSPLQGAVVADGAAQHGITDLKRVEDGTLRDRTCDFDFDFASNVGKGAKMLWEFDSNHATPTRLDSPRKIMDAAPTVASGAASPQTTPYFTAVSWI